MKRNNDLIRAILLAVEKQATGEKVVTLPAAYFRPMFPKDNLTDGIVDEHNRNLSNPEKSRFHSNESLRKFLLPRCPQSLPKFLSCDTPFLVVPKNPQNRTLRIPFFSSGGFLTPHRSFGNRNLRHRQNRQAKAVKNNIHSNTNF